MNQTQQDKLAIALKDLELSLQVSLVHVFNVQEHLKQATLGEIIKPSEEAEK